MAQLVLAKTEREREPGRETLQQAKQKKKKKEKSWINQEGGIAGSRRPTTKSCSDHLAWRAFGGFGVCSLGPEVLRPLCPMLWWNERVGETGWVKGSLSVHPTMWNKWRHEHFVFIHCLQLIALFFVDFSANVFTTIKIGHAFAPQYG